MKRSASLSLLLAPFWMAALAAALILAGCGGDEVAAEPEAPAAPVRVGRVVRETVPVQVSAIGTVESRSTVEVRAQVDGEITAVHFREGQEVTKGQPLFTIDPRPYRAAVEEAEARLERDRALAENAAAEVARYQDLVAKDYVTREEFDRIQAQAASQKAGAAADRAALDRARLALSWTTVRAPASGRTGKLLVHGGNLVKENDQTLVVIQQIEPIDVTFSVPQVRLDEVRARADAGSLTVTAEPPGSAAHEGRLSFVDNRVDPETGTISLKATFPNRDRALWPGQFANVTLDLATEADAVVAPAAAVQTGQDGDYVFVVTSGAEGDTVDQRAVTVAHTAGERAVIAEGLSGGETVVTDGQLRLVPGAKVEILEESGPVESIEPVREEAR